MKRKLGWMMAVTSLGAALVGSSALSGCALTEKGEARDVSYYALEVPAPRAAAAAPERRPEVAAADAPRLRLGRISASTHLGKRLVYRTSSVDVGIDDERRWTERPEEYTRRSLAGALFGPHGITESLTGADPTPDVEVLAFEEIRSGSARRARVELRYALHDDQQVLLSDSIAVETGASSGRTDDVVRALSIALSKATERVAERVASRIAARAQ